MCVAGGDPRSRLTWRFPPGHAAYDTYDTGWTLNGPDTSVIDPTSGKPYPSRFHSTKKGSMNALTGLGFFKAIAEMYPDLSTAKGFRVLVICDGHGSHLTKEILEFCREVGIDLVLRIPHSSQDTQNEDLVNFAVLENEFVHQKALRLAKVRPLRCPVQGVRWCTVLCCGSLPRPATFLP